MNTEISITLPVHIEEQEDSQLCWAAAAVAISKFYDGDKTLSQKDLAVHVFGESSYNHVLSPQEAFELTGNFKAMTEGPITIEEILDELKHGRPVAACMRYFIGWHLVIIYGASSSGELFIADSMHGSSSVNIGDFREAYLGSYSWSHSIFTQINQV